MVLSILGVAAFLPAPAGSTGRAGAFTTGEITPDHAESYVITDTGAGFTAEAPSSNRYGNLRLAVIADDAPNAVDQSACVTWNGPDAGIGQPGIVLRSTIEPGRTRAIMVTNNVWAHFRSAFNVHLADSTAQEPLLQIGSAELPDAVGTAFELLPLPWRICGRVIGSTLQIKAWSVPSHASPPAWGDHHYGTSMRLPEDWVMAGKPGVYIGHLQAGEAAEMTDLVTTSIGRNTSTGYWGRSRAWVRRLIDAARPPSTQ